VDAGGAGMSEIKADELEHIAYMQTLEIQKLTARIAELEGENKKAFDLVRKLRMYCIYAEWDNPDTEDEFNEFDAEVCEWLSKFMERAQ